jgi:hypothetical protein
MNKKKVKKKILANLSDEIEKQNQDYGSNDEIKKIQIDKCAKNTNLKPKH